MFKTILFGVPFLHHRQLCIDEMDDLANLGFVTYATVYGSTNEKNDFLRSVKDLSFNLIRIFCLLILRRPNLIYLNTAYDRKALVRDSILIFFLSVPLKIFRCKLILKFHGSDPSCLLSKKLSFRLMNKLLKSNVEAYLVLSNEEKKNFMLSDFQEKRLFVVKNIINGNKFTKSKSFNFKYGFKEDDILLFYIGRMIKSKGVLEVIDAFNILAINNTILKLVCVGGGSEYDLAVARVRKELSNRVLFTGNIHEDQTPEFYSNCDIFVFPTAHNEGFSMALFKSIAAGLGVITTKIRAADDYLKEPDNCFWVDQGNASQIAAKIEYLIANPHVLNAMKKNNLILARSFSSEIVSNELGKILNGFTN